MKTEELAAREMMRVFDDKKFVTIFFCVVCSFCLPETTSHRHRSNRHRFLNKYTSYTTTMLAMMTTTTTTTTSKTLLQHRHQQPHNSSALLLSSSRRQQGKKHRLFSTKSKRHQNNNQFVTTSASAFERRYVSSTASSSSPSTSTKSMMCDLLTDDESIKWASAKALVMELGFDDDEADKVMQKGFGWGKQDYWRNEKVREIPDMDEIEKRIQFIESLGVARDKIDVIVGKLPEILAMDIDGVMKPAVEHIEKNFFMKRGTPAFAKYVIRVPQALGNTIDCEGTCVGDCNRCWVRV